MNISWIYLFIFFFFRNIFDLTDDYSNVMKISIEKDNNDSTQVILINRKGVIYRYGSLKHFFDYIM